MYDVLVIGGGAAGFYSAIHIAEGLPNLRIAILERGKDVCWGESNAVVYANSVLGSRTEKYADYLDICAALVGKTVAVGVHLEQNRRPEIVLKGDQFSI